ncbi:MAG: ribulose-phosphate 3-epimerase [Bryobacterales bacterium]|nr:ribulose-phosphate 3-epimerase [Bryobacterales bacterium]
MAVVAPSILSADFARLAEQVELVKQAGVKMVHVDVMDGHFVPNLTLGPPVVKSLRAATDLLLDCHLMIEDPDRYTPDFVKAGAGIVTVHQEACRHLHRSIQLIRSEGARAGVAINPATPVSTLEHILADVALVLVMSVNPGFGGQEFLPFSLEKVEALRAIREERNLSFQIEIDGGVSLDNVGAIVNAGADILVAGSSIFGTPDPASAVKSMQERIREARMVRV